ncbi:hypothetical protein PAXRUDRAFT_147764 [Paxillus rubicundulus Ve08.2h10]|uniref:SAP domain-containing protein n=1 Tax=Paxillus rubicundulus Ve08.2h10 TaxID=930991 RepID=A0A0D0D641_9AGAM|nr:hypothetical protein PAXRUDRAFT_147764 [Paxillus rubicundulus Ve08.2h10]
MAPVAYSGALQSKKKAELQEIARALHLSDAGTKEDIQNRIKKHLDQNQSLLEDNPAFSGLFGKRKRSTQPLPVHVRSVPSPASESGGEIVAKNSSSPGTTRSTRRSFALDPIHDATPVPEVREVSMMLKNPPISPPEEETSTSILVNPTPHKDASRMITSTPRGILRNVAKPSVQLATTTFQRLQADAKQRARVFILASRSTLSNSVNIWLITALLELLYVLYVVIPWESVEFPSSRPAYSGNFYVSIPYLPLTTFQSWAFWGVLAHWSIPALVIPAVLGSVVSFHPANATSARIPRVLPLDPLTASIMRLAAQYAYPYETLNATLHGVDVIGPRWRILNSAVGVALAFTEAIFTAPSAYAEARMRHRAGTPRRVTAPEDSLSNFGES